MLKHGSYNRFRQLLFATDQSGRSILRPKGQLEPSLVVVHQILYLVTCMLDNYLDIYIADRGLTIVLRGILLVSYRTVKSSALCLVFDVLEFVLP